MTGRPRDSGADEQWGGPTAATAFVSLDTDGTVRFVDDGWLALTGHERVAVVGEQFVEVVSESDRDTLEDVFEDVLDGDEATTTIPIRKSDETTVATTLEARPEWGLDGDVSRMHCRLEPRDSAVTPGTDERLFEVAPVGVFRTTTGGRVLSVNQRLASMLGYDTPEEAIAAHDDLEADLYVDPERRETFLERLRAEGAVEDFEYEARTAGGQPCWLSMNARLLGETDDGARVIAGFARDVTDRKRRDRQLALLERILRHNIRNALTVVQGQAELLRWEQADAQDAVGTILKRTDTLLRQAEKERELTELLRGSTEPTEHDVVGLVENARTTVLEAHPDATVTIDGSGSAVAAVINGFERAIAELLDNALRHGDEPEASVTIRDGSDHVEITIADSGPGMPDAERQLLTGSIEETPLFHGSGVGLFLVRQLVVWSNGTISVADNEPRGTVVTVRLSS
ncbi:MAG: ATP-binding protein [Halapricum sp.]